MEPLSDALLTRFLYPRRFCTDASPQQLTHFHCSDWSRPTWRNRLVRTFSVVRRVSASVSGSTENARRGHCLLDQRKTCTPTNTNHTWHFRLTIHWGRRAGCSSGNCWRSCRRCSREKWPWLVQCVDAKVDSAERRSICSAVAAVVVFAAAAADSLSVERQCRAR